MAVYTEVSDQELKSFVALYDIGEVQSCKGIAEGVENSNYLLQTTRGKYIVTLYEKRVSVRELPFFLGLMEHLALQNFFSPTPVRGRDGELCRTLCEKLAAITTFLPGSCPIKIAPSHCEQLGIATAKMHLATNGYNFERRNQLGRSGWSSLFGQVSDKANNYELDLYNIIREELVYLDRNWPSNLPKGIIHGDLFPDNVFFQNELISGIIDFYFACSGSYAYEIAICLNAWCFENDISFSVTKAKSLVKGYNSIRELNTQELAALPLLARGSALRFLLTRLYDIIHHPTGALVKPKDPLEYFKKLLFHQKATGPSAYGLD